jgi:PQQ-dependent dehydrogenase (s-GDH family)
MKKNYSFIIFFCLIFLGSANILFSQSFTYYKQVFKVDTLYPSTGTKGMNSAWELVYGPDDSLWVTESHNYKVWKINPNNKGSRVILDLNNSKDFTSSSVGMWPQGGLMGLAIHPQFYEGKPWVYIAYVYHVVYCALDVCYCTNKPPCVYNTKIVRYNYNFSDGSLTVIDTVISNLNGSNDHNSGRIKISPVAESDGLYHLYYTIGDMGAGNNNNNINRTNNAQDTTIYEGKVLRLNTEPDIAQSGGAEWIPDDNPFPSNAAGVLKNAIYSYGHRNPQGLAFGSSDNGATYNLYSSEHGDKSDDEVNIINPHTNYGWPKVAGLCDDNYTSTLNDSMYLASKSVINETNFCLLNHVREPIFSFYNWSREDTKISGSNSNNYNWPTIAPTSIAFYGSSTIPGWKNSLLIPSLKNGLFRLKLKADGLSIDSASNPADTISYFHGYRLRNIISAPTGDTLFISVDSSCCTLGTAGVINGSQVATPDMGYILRMVYLTTLPLEEYIPPPPQVTGPASVKVYPNPASNYLYVQSIKGMHKPLRAQLYDMSGRLILETITADDNFSINIKGQARGTYIFKLFSGYDIETDTEKIVID